MTPILTNTSPILSLSVSHQPDGPWAVIRSDGTVISIHDTNAQAWRAADRASNEPLNKREATADFVFSKMAAGDGVRSPNEVKRKGKWKGARR